MSENPIVISNLNDFIFCPVSIYFHALYGETDRISMQKTSQINGSAVHESIDNASYSTEKGKLQGLSVYSEKYGLIGKIDLFDVKSGKLIERKRTIKNIYDGYVFQLYAQYFGLMEMGYIVKSLCLYSYTDNKSYPIKMPEDDPDMLKRFEDTIEEMHSFHIENFFQTNVEKCNNCIYEPACDRSCK